MAEKKKDPKTAHEIGSFEDSVVRCIMDYVEESALVKRPRMLQNKLNWDAYFMRGDFSHKIEGQSREYLPKSAVAAEQLTALISSTLTNFDKWFMAIWVGKDEDPVFTPELVKTLMGLYLEKAKIKLILADGTKVGVHEGTVTIKRYGEYRDSVRFKAKGKSLRKVTTPEWSLGLTVICGEDYFPDPYAEGGELLYEVHQMSVDYHRIVQRTEGSEAIYDEKLVSELQSNEDLEIEQRKSRNRGEPSFNRRSQRRKPVLIHEFVGSLLGADGKPILNPETQEPLMNVIATVANRTTLIRKPEENPRWDGTSGIVSAPILRTPFAAFSKAIMDAAQYLNVSINELFNLMLDGGLSAVHGIKTVRAGWLEDPGAISKGIPPGTTLVVREDAPFGAPVMERVDTGNIPQDVLSFFNILTGLHTDSALTNETRLGGLPSKQVRATEIVASNQALTGIFDAITKEFEVALVEPLLQGVWNDILQNIDEFPMDDLVRIAGPERAQIIQNMSRQERFAAAGQGFKFIAKGLSTLTERLKDFQRLAQFLSVVGANPDLLNEFKKEFSMPRLLGKFMHALSIDSEEIKMTKEEIKQKEQLDAAIQAYVQRAVNENAAGKSSAANGSGQGAQASLPQQPETSAAESEFVAGNGAGQA